jgi:hypothetical protein
MKKLFVLWVYMTTVLNLFGQDSIKKKIYYNDLNFIIHLTENNLFSEAESESQRILNDVLFNRLYSDSVNYILGMAYYNVNRTKEAKSALLKVSDDVLFYYKARYLSAQIEMDAEKFDSALSLLCNISESSITYLEELKKFEIAGMYLLKKQYQKFDSISAQLQFTNNLLKDEFLNMKHYANLEKNMKVKSMLLAGCLSAFIPGLGKVYAGNNGQAISTFLTCGLFGAIASENIINQGLKSPSAIFFTSLFGLFYIGNIWGSALSVQLINTEKKFENKHNILIGLKLPIDKFFK